MGDTIIDMALASTGAKLGLKTGAITALLYIGCSVLFGSFADPGGTGIEPGLIGVIVMAGCVIGVLPALLIGALTGWVIGALLERFRTRLSRDRAAVIGLLVCLVFALPLNVVFWIERLTGFSTISQVGPYAFLLGVPSLIYIAVGAGMSTRLYTTYLADRQTSRP